MKAILTREKKENKQTIGTFRLYDQNKEIFSARSLELPWRDNDNNVSCIPEGIYQVKMVNSPRFGKTFGVMDVPERQNILIHAGNYNTDTHGCIMLGKLLADMNHDGFEDITNSAGTVTELMKITDAFELKITS